jgi:hypothetical protein
MSGHHILGFLVKMLKNNYGRFEDLMAVNMKMTVIWDVTICSPVDVWPSFRRMCCPYLQGIRIPLCFENGGSKFLQNVHKHVSDYTAIFT